MGWILIGVKMMLKKARFYSTDKQNEWVKRVVTNGTNEEDKKKTLILTVFFDQIQQSREYCCEIKILIYKHGMKREVNF